MMKKLLINPVFWVTIIVTAVIVLGFARLIFMSNIGMETYRVSSALYYHLREDPNFETTIFDNDLIEDRLRPSAFKSFFKIWVWNYEDLSPDPKLWREAAKIRDNNEKKSESDRQARKECFNQRIDEWLEKQQRA